MCKLSLNIVPNVYNSLLSSFLSLAWPWPGRSLPKGNQWECWDPGLEPNVVRLQVHLPPQCIPYTPTPPDIPTPLMPPIGLNTPRPQRSPQMLPYATYSPFGPWVPTPSTSPQYIPWHPYTPDSPNIPNTPRSPQCHLYHFWPLSTYTACQPPIHHWYPTPPCWSPTLPRSPNTSSGPWVATLCQPPVHLLHPLIPLMALQHPLHSLVDPNGPLCHLYPFWPLSTYTPCQPPIHPLMPCSTPNGPQQPLMPLIPPISLLVFNYHHVATDCLCT